MKKIFSIILALLIVFSLTAAVSAEEYIDRSGWRVTASSERTSENFTADRVIDGDIKTYWHTNYVSDSDKDEAPFYLTFYLPAVATISGFSYTPRQGNNTGAATAYNIYALESDSGKATLIYSGVFSDDTETKRALFGFNVDVKTVVFEITEGKWGYGTCAEFNLIAADGSVKKTIAEVGKGSTVTVGAYGASEDESTVSYVDRSGWSVTASSTRIKDNRMPEHMLDGDTKTYWHSDYENGDDRDRPPYTLTFTLPALTTISGFAYIPRQDNESGIVTAYNIYASDSDTAEELLIYSGTMPGNKSTQKVFFGFTVDVKKVVFEITAGKWDYGTCAEFYLYADNGTVKRTLGQVAAGGGNGEKIKNKNGWEAVASSSRLPHYPAKNTIDGNASTIWHSNYTDDGVATILSHEENPHWIEVTLPKSTVISGFSYTTRDSSTGRILGYEFYVSDSDSGEWTLIETGTFADNAAEKEVKFPMNIEIKKFKFQSVTSVGGYGVIAELDLFSEILENKTASNYEEFIETYDSEKLIQIPSEGMQATASSVWRNSNAAALAVDGVQKTAWHSSTDDWKEFPVTLDVDLGGVYSVSEIIYLPRIDDTSMNGIWTKFNIWAGDDFDNLELVKKNASLEVNLFEQKITFDEPVNAKYFEFEILAGHNGYATCGDLLFYEKASSIKNREENKIKYTLKIGSNEIKITENGEIRTVTMDVAPYIDGGYTQIPLRGLLEEMGAEFTWDGEYNKITVKEDTAIIEMQIYNNIVTVTSRMYGEVIYTLRSVPQIKDSRTFVPLRFISENLGYTVTWDGDTEEITIVK